MSATTHDEPQAIDGWFPDVREENAFISPCSTFVARAAGPRTYTDADGGHVAVLDAPHYVVTLSAPAADLFDGAVPQGFQTPTGLPFVTFAQTLAEAAEARSPYAQAHLR